MRNQLRSLFFEEFVSAGATHAMVVIFIEESVGLLVQVRDVLMSFFY